jgi:hypothetical protein
MKGNKAISLLAFYPCILYHPFVTGSVLMDFSFHISCRVTWSCLLKLNIFYYAREIQLSFCPISQASDRRVEIKGESMGFWVPQLLYLLKCRSPLVIGTDLSLQAQGFSPVHGTCLLMCSDSFSAWSPLFSSVLNRKKWRLSASQSAEKA